MNTFTKTLAALPLIIASSFSWADPVDINTANAMALADSLNGVGPAKAEAIVAYRDELGPFLTVEDLALVKGIGETTIEKNRSNLTITVPVTN